MGTMLFTLATVSELTSLKRWRNKLIYVRLEPLCAGISRELQGGNDGEEEDIVVCSKACDNKRRDGIL